MGGTKLHEFYDDENILSNSLVKISLLKIVMIWIPIIILLSNDFYPVYSFTAFIPRTAAEIKRATDTQNIGLMGIE
jgi:hypothetical protein